MKRLNEILIIDDDEVSNYITMKMVEHAEITDKITSFKSGSRALEYLKTRHKNEVKQPVVVLLDLLMCDINGWEFLEEFENQDDDFRSDLHLYFLTTSLNEKDREMALEHPHVDGFFQKPISMENLQHVKNTHLDNPDSTKINTTLLSCLL